MACKCCQQYAPKPFDGSEQPPCPGDASIEEARDLARLWYQRAQEAGWTKPAQMLSGRATATSSLPFKNTPSQAE